MPFGDPAADRGSWRRTVMKGGVSIGRRAALRVLGGAGGAALAMGLGACSLSPSSDAPKVRIPISDLPVGVRVRVVYGGHPVEVLRTAEGVTARSLLCTHMGCEVRWNQGLRTYNCPCHGGVYGADGVVVAGPPGHALRSVPVRIEGDAVVLGG
jgi:cytochrome b6-f complex iron-sulfur subunit